jgi:hypothetical protein
MSATGTSGSTRAPSTGHHDDGATARGINHARRLTTETKSSYKTTEMIAYVVVLLGILIAGLVIKGGADDEFQASRVWLYATILTGAYMISRGLAKSGSREPYDDDRS